MLNEQIGHSAGESRFRFALTDRRERGGQFAESLLSRFASSDLGPSSHSHQARNKLHLKDFHKSWASG